MLSTSAETKSLKVLLGQAFNHTAQNHEQTYYQGKVYFIDQQCLVLTVIQEFADLQLEHPEGMKVELVSESDLHKWMVTVDGPKDSPYAGGKFQLLATLPNEYPFKPPVFNWKTKIYHPNVTNDGKGSMCLGLIKDEEWKPSTRMYAALEYARQLLIEPNADDPVEGGIADEYKHNYKQYVKTAKQWTKTYA
ncbi:MAG: hypothetical protein Q9166_005422 [cf. Caloplaca sp. 2 TL-2023]